MVIGAVDLITITTKELCIDSPRDIYQMQVAVSIVTPKEETTQISTNIKYMVMYLHSAYYRPVKRNTLQLYSIIWKKNVLNIRLRNKSQTQKSTFFYSNLLEFQNKLNTLILLETRIMSAPLQELQGDTRVLLTM
jgi:hypothetical protein